MNTYLLKEATKMAMMTATAVDANIEDDDVLTELIMSFYLELEAFALVLQFSINEIEYMDASMVAKLISKYED